jgi:hypothetical protein
MATPTVISGTRPRVRTAHASLETYAGSVALDWANAQAISLSGSSVQSSAFDASNDRIVLCSVGGASTVGGCWIAVGTSPVAAAAAGSMWLSQNSNPQPVYVPAGDLIAALQGQTGGTLSMVPALISSDP